VTAKIFGVEPGAVGMGESAPWPRQFTPHQIVAEGGVKIGEQDFGRTPVVMNVTVYYHRSLL
jgi:hypothetical protein